MGRVMRDWLVLIKRGDGRCCCVCVGLGVYLENATAVPPSPEMWASLDVM